MLGDSCLFGSGVHICPPTHPLDPEIRKTGIEGGKPIFIGDNVWVGSGAIICPGVSIGNNSVIGAGSVVTKDIPENCIAVGNPCKVIKNIEKKD